MSTIATSAGALNIVSAKLHIPSAGAWRADLLLDHGDPPTGAATVTIGDLVLVGTVLRSGLDAADRPHCTVIGGRGWFASVSAPRAFQSTAGVRLGTVLAALASGAGQTIVQPADRTIGEYYELQASRPGEPVTYADALNDLARTGACPPWRVDPDGVTRFGPRQAQAVTGRATLLRSDRGTGFATYGLDAPATWLPGHTVDGVAIDRIDICENAGKLEADVWLTEAAAPIRDLVRRMVAHELGERIRTYTVASCDSATGDCDLVPPPDARHLPGIKACKQYTGASIYRASKGDAALVVLADANRTRPRIIGFAPVDGPFADDARTGDSVDVLLPPMVFVGTIAGSPATGVMTATLAKTLGAVSTGSSKRGTAT
jgi:hypothetical protein